jgi:nitroreductase
MDVIDAIKTRRTIRKFTEQPIEFDKLANIIEAGIHAPSAGNMQNWRFILLTDEGAIKSLYRHCMKQEVIYNAQAAIIVCGVMDKAERLYGLRGKRLYTVQNCASATQNMLLAAHAQDLGACWIGAFDEDQVSNMFGIPENARPQAIIAIGYPDEKPIVDRKALTSVVYFNKYGLKIKDLHLLLKDFSVEWDKQIKIVGKTSKKGFKTIREKLNDWWKENNKRPSTMRSVLEKRKEK